MLATSNLMAFVATKDAARAMEFYRDVLGLRLLGDEPFALVFDANGTSLRVQKVRDVTLAPYTALGWEVRDIRGAIRRLVEKGVSFVRFGESFAGFKQDEFGIWTADDGTQVAWFKDPDGNTLSLTEFRVHRTSRGNGPAPG